jgi:hypothetical protein
MADWLAVGGKTYRDDTDPSLEARARDAFERLQFRGLVRQERNTLYLLTGDGFDYAKEVLNSDEIELNSQ